MRVLKDGSITSLFINKKDKMELNVWRTAECIPTKGFAVRTGFHTLGSPYAPHLSMKDRAWFEVEIEDYTELNRPAHQGGKWYLANRMRLIKQLYDEDVFLIRIFEFD